MDSRGTDRADDAIAETPDDVAVLYSWANLHGAKYRDFSASRREYRAQLRHRAAEQVREQALLAQAEAEDAAAVADAVARQANEALRSRRPEESDSSVQRTLRKAEEAVRTAAAERVEAARRAEAAAVAKAAARREEREIAEAHAAAQRQAARYADSELHQGSIAGQQETDELPGQVSDPYTVYFNAHWSVPPVIPAQPNDNVPSPYSMKSAPIMQPFDKQQQDSVISSSERATDQHVAEQPAVLQAERRPYATPPRRPQGYHPDDASGVRQIYRGPDYDAPPAPAADAKQSRTQEIKPGNEQYAPSPGASSNMPGSEGQPASYGQRRTDTPLASAVRPQPVEPGSAAGANGFVGSSGASSSSGVSSSLRDAGVSDRSGEGEPRQGFGLDAASSAQPNGIPASKPFMNVRPAPAVSTETRPLSPFSQALSPSDATRGRRAQDDFDYQQAQTAPGASRRTVPEPSSDAAAFSPQRSPYSSEAAGPAWLYAPPVPPAPQRPAAQAQTPVQSSVADTLQHSRERVAARWFALKGVFEQPGQEPESVPVRQKETRTPVLAVFSLAGGVGKTSLVATVGRALSSMGEKVLLTDTTSHGLLPFYFGASELRQGTVRTFSPPSGSTDAPIYLVSYDVEQRAADDEAQEQLAEEIISNSRGTHRILLDLTVRSSWIVRRLSRLNPTILVPVAPDMNSVISLQTVEKFFNGVSDGDGHPVQPYYVLNQFDPSLPLHLDVREVMRRQLGDRLLPFVIRRAPAVSEALAEGMTVVDYAPDAAVAEDYLNLATWLRTVAAPATAGFRNVRWSER